jgi:hypothetical protein
MRSETDEVMLAQEQGVIMKGVGVKKEVEGEFGFGGEREGTLILTDRRLIFVSTNEKEDDFRIGRGRGATRMSIVYSDVEDLDSIPADPGNLFVPISSISSVKGYKMEVARPGLEVKWWEGSEEKGRVFTERVTGHSRRRNINDWATVIERLKAGDQKLIQIPEAPTIETLEGKIMRILSDMQWKGALGIEDAVESSFNIQLDPDEVQAACDKLCSQGLLKQKTETGIVFYQKCSPLGNDNLSD